ncbi:GntR family transcriptional regulator [Alkalicoccobacillus gibsonii]|uniref:GntR family transcriptional regulator n=1 Tax=Alkalicoccobacillus gibsonii TaxID=79881 RepID=UPI003516FD05
MQGKSESRMYDELLVMIESGEIKPRGQMPSEHELVQQFGVPRLTVRKAYEQLESRGYVNSVKGKGRFVKEASKQVKLHLSTGESFTEKMLAAGYNLRTEVFKAEMGEDVFKISRLRVLDGEPIAIHTSYINRSLFPKIEIEGSRITSVFAYYQSCGYTTFSNGKSVLSVQFPSTDEQERLNCSAVVPLIKLSGSTMDAGSGELLERTEILYRGDKFTYELDH